MRVNDVGLSQAKIARDLGLKRSYISQFENGRYQFSETELWELRSYLDECFYKFVEEEMGEPTNAVCAEQAAPNQFDDMKDYLSRIQEILTTPVPKIFFIFDDEDELNQIREHLLFECLSLVKKCADASGYSIGSWDDQTMIASRIYE